MQAMLMTSRPFLFLLFISVLSSCAVQLAPQYDSSLYEGLTQTNIKVMELFASVTPETAAGSFKEREQTYNNIIGTIDALALQSKARPVPDNAMVDKINEFLQSRGGPSFNSGVVPSANALEEISRQLVRMKEQDRNSGLQPAVIAVFKNAVVISMDQAITYEAFLER